MLPASHRLNDVDGSARLPGSDGRSPAAASAGVGNDHEGAACLRIAQWQSAATQKRHPPPPVHRHLRPTANAASMAVSNPASIRRLSGHDTKRRKLASASAAEPPPSARLILSALGARFNPGGSHETLSTTLRVCRAPPLPTPLLILSGIPRAEPTHRGGWSSASEVVAPARRPCGPTPESEQLRRPAGPRVNRAIFGVARLNLRRR